MRSRLAIAAQGIGVAALGIIVYVAFLSPTDSGPLSGIDVQPPIEGQPPPEREAKRVQRTQKPKPKRARRPAARPAPAVVGAPTAQPPADSVPHSPAGEQYAGTVARILARVAEAGR